MEDMVSDNTVSEGDVFVGNVCSGESVYQDTAVRIEETIKSGDSIGRNQVFGAENFVCGAESYDIINGAGYVVHEGNYYFGFEDGIYLNETGAEDKIGSDYAENLNVMDDMLYYSTYRDGVQYIRALSLKDYSVTTVAEWTDKCIVEMYVVNHDYILFLSNKQIYCYVISEQRLADYALDSTAVFSFAPTRYGLIYAEGSLFDYTLYTEERRLLSGVSDYYVDGEAIMLRFENEDYEILIDKIYKKADDLAIKANAIAPFNIFDYMTAPSNFETISYEEFMEEIADNGDEQEWENVEVEEEPAAGATKSMSTVPVRPVGVTPAVTSPEQDAIVARADEVYETEWVALDDILPFKLQYDKCIKKGDVVRGIPYGQPLANGKFVLYDISLSEFLNQARNINSILYTKDDEEMGSYYKDGRDKCPYYSTDCSTFVSFCWGLKNRYGTGNLPNFGVKKPKTNTFKGIQVGDAINRESHHVILITDIGYDKSGKIVSGK